MSGALGALGAVGSVDPIGKVTLTLTQRSKKSGRAENPQGLVTVGLSSEGDAPEGGGEGRAGKKQRTRAVQFGGPFLQLGSAAVADEDQAPDHFVGVAAPRCVTPDGVGSNALPEIFREAARTGEGPPSLPRRDLVGDEAVPGYQPCTFSRLSFLPLAGDGGLSSVLSPAREPDRQAPPTFVAAAVSGSPAARVPLEGALKSAIKFIDPKIGRHPGEGRGPELTMDPGLRRDDEMPESNDQGAAFNSPLEGPATDPGPEFSLSKQAHLEELTKALSLLGDLGEYKKLCQEDAQEAAQEAGGLLLGHNARPFQTLRFGAPAAPVPSAAPALNS